VSLETFVVREDEGSSAATEQEPLYILADFLAAVDELAPSPAQRLSNFFFDEMGMMDQAEEALADDESIDDDDDDAFDAWVQARRTWFDAGEVLAAARAVHERVEAGRDSEFSDGLPACRGRVTVDDALAELSQLVQQLEEAAKDGVRVSMSVLD